ncbi:MAG: DUF2147 domain-containing protein [Saprospiraceae bacterium]|nr:DUF2147 domain-containing protein [Saprospiraceae bacterium]
MCNSSFSELFPQVLFSDFLRYFLVASAAYLVFWVIFFKKWQHRIIQRKLPETNKMWLEFRYSMSTVLIFALIGFGILNMKKAGFTLIYDNIAEWGMLWFVVSLVLMILLHDAWFYWTHRLMHHPKIFRHVHLVHHRSTNPSPWAAYSFHPIEAVIAAGIFILIAFTIPAHGLALFIFLIYMIFRNVMGHLGIEFLPKNFIANRWINWHTTTTHHDLHHKHFNHNYGLYFTWWDKWFGTEHPNYRETFEEVTSREKESGSLLSARTTKILFGVILLGNVAAAQSPVGTWKTVDDKSGNTRSIVQIEEKSGLLEGKVTQIFLQPCEQPEPVCSKCSGERKNAKIVGMNFLWGFKKDGEKWTSGYILDPGNGTTYRSSMWLEDADTLKVRGYWGMFWRTQTWNRVTL